MSNDNLIKKKDKKLKREPIAQNVIKEGKTDDQIFFPDGKDITIAGKKYNIKPYVIKENRQVLKIIVDNFKDMAGAKEKFIKAGDLGAIGLLVEHCADGLTEVYALTLKEEKSYIENTLTFKDEKILLETIWGLNDFSFLVSKVKELIEAGKKIQKQQKIPQD